MKKSMNHIVKWSGSVLEKGFFFEILLLIGILYLFIGNGWKIYCQYIGQSKGAVVSYIDAGKMMDLSVSELAFEGDMGAYEVGMASMETAATAFARTLQRYFENLEYENVLRVDADHLGVEEIEENIEAEALEAENIETEVVENEKLPEFQTCTVEDFSNSVFLGDSRVVGLMKYGELNEYAQFYASTGMTIYKLFQTPIATVEGKLGKVTLEEAFTQRQFDRIYLCVGINEMGTGDVDFFVEAYKEVVDHIRELQPEAQIYIQSIIAVTKKRSDQRDYINNEGIYARNEGISKLADNQTIFYLDVNSVLCDESGALNSEYTSDGVHLKAQYLSLWREYLLQHVAK